MATMTATKKTAKTTGKKKTAKKSGRGGSGGGGGATEAAGIGDAAVAKATGKGWGHWFGVLDRFDVKKNGHKAASIHLGEKHTVAPWWSQMLVVGYEQNRGLRAKHQNVDGFSANGSRTVNVPIANLYKAWQGKAPLLWLPDAAEFGAFTVRRATANRSMRLIWGDGTSLDVMFYDKSKPGAPKSQVTIDHTKLPTAAAAEKMKKYWGEALDTLRALLEK